MNSFFMFGGTMRDKTTRLKKGEEVIHSYFCQSSFAEYPLDKINEAITAAEKGEFLKAMIKM